VIRSPTVPGVGDHGKTKGQLRSARGTAGSNSSPSSEESVANLTFGGRIRSILVARSRVLNVFVVAPVSVFGSACSSHSPRAAGYANQNSAEDIGSAASRLSQIGLHGRIERAEEP
jgi:hypothetical protein